MFYDISDAYSLVSGRMGGQGRALSCVVVEPVCHTGESGGGCGEGTRARVCAGRICGGGGGRVRA